MIFGFRHVAGEGYLALAGPNLWNGVVDDVVLKFLIYDIDVFREECLALFLVGVCVFFLLVAVMLSNCDGIAGCSEKCKSE